MTWLPEKKSSEWLACAVCNKPVDRVEWIDDLYRGQRVFRAYCHGEKETAVLDHITLEDSLYIKFTRAFERPLLEVPRDHAG